MQELQQLFTISSGYTFRDAIAGLTPGKVGVVQSGDITGDRLSDIARIDFDKSNSLLHDGDILLSIRGKFIARTVTLDLLPAVAASSVFVLRPTDKNINTRYIARYINSSQGQAKLSTLTSGSHIKTLRKSDLVTFQVPQPPAVAQQTVIQLHDTIEQYRQTLSLKERLLQQLDDTVINQIKLDSRKTSSILGSYPSEPETDLSERGIAVATVSEENRFLAGRDEPRATGILRKSSKGAKK